MRDKADHEATAMMKAQFMSLWDGKHYLYITEKPPLISKLCLILITVWVFNPDDWGYRVIKNLLLPTLKE